MTTRYEISQVDVHVLRSLTWCVRFLSTDQIARFTRQSRPTAKRRMKQLVSRGLATKYRLIAQAPPDVRRPLASWSPGDSPPCVSTVSQQAIRRYLNRELLEITAYRATSRTFAHYGLRRPSPPKRFQQTHDLGLSETFVHFALRWPRLTRRCWLGEDVFAVDRERFEKVEDAQLRLPGEKRPFLAVEFVGKYKPQRLADLAQALMQRELPFRWY